VNLINTKYKLTNPVELFCFVYFIFWAEWAWDADLGLPMTGREQVVPSQ